MYEHLDHPPSTTTVMAGTPLDISPHQFQSLIQSASFSSTHLCLYKGLPGHHRNTKLMFSYSCAWPLPVDICPIQWPPIVDILVVSRHHMSNKSSRTSPFIIIAPPHREVSLRIKTCNFCKLLHLYFFQTLWLLWFLLLFMLPIKHSEAVH